MLGLFVAVVHLLALPLGVSVLMLRGRALAAVQRPEDLKPVFFWDNLAGLVALFWIGSGLWRAFGGLEKGSAYYLSNHVFWAKMALLLVVLALESIPMATFIGWRVQLGRKRPVSLERKAALVKIHWAEFWVMIGMVVCAVLMARGVGNARAQTAVSDGPREAVMSPDVTAGASVYRTRCLSCHQADGRGVQGRVAADFVGDSSRLAKPDTVLLSSIARGVPNTAMRGFGEELSPEQIRDVLTYIRHAFAAKLP